MDDKQEYVSAKTLAARLGIAPESIHWLVGSAREQLTWAEVEYVVSFRRRIRSETDAARARMNARCDALGITPSECLRQQLEECNGLYPGKSLSEIMDAEGHKQGLEQFSLQTCEVMANALQSPRQGCGSGIDPFDLALQVGRVYVEEFGRLGAFTPKELEQNGLGLGWIIFEEFGRSRVPEEIAELVLVHIRSECKKHVEALLAELD